ncbi:hypothetical protein KV644_003677 [Salmonella enterica]|uniref:hypothetical protein n=1 Tax=Salmonella enterica TaxID=28901 RepID=UPI0009B056F2|nr:hypothetical protein [Salmonella enterica]EHQ0126168.1 hypothetical protein [Salmonella enterica subsp. enterica serovar Elisabethville]EHS4831059.1 hypothetical protein [Salmonella enterica]EHS4839959.1 hypothetical protein [Salmonella enterica]EHS4844705.1 hypothetical protein [Salmonella enterica]EHS4891398.1 hypothetical protein [Salmonella enterica]
MIHTFTLKTGLPYGTGDDAQYQVDVELQELNTGMMLAAQEVAEKVVMVPGPASSQPELVVSPTILGAELTRRRIRRVGVINGPLSRELLNKLTPEDLGLINAEIEKMDSALLLSGINTSGSEVADRGRVVAVSE